MANCKRCGVTIEDGASLCPNCRAQLEANATAPNKARLSRPMPGASPDPAAGSSPAGSPERSAGGAKSRPMPANAPGGASSAREGRSSSAHSHSAPKKSHTGAIAAVVAFVLVAALAVVLFVYPGALRSKQTSDSSSLKTENMGGTDGQTNGEPKNGAPDASDGTVAETQAAPAQTEPAVTEDPEDLTGHEGVETPAVLSGNIYVTENCGYGVYGFIESSSGRYADGVSALAAACKGKADVYCMICPISAGIMLSDSVQQQIGLGNEKEAMDWMFDRMSSDVKKVNIYNTLRKHNDEYIYFHTDHHWTSLGAYYAYCEFCRVKGVEPHKLTDFQKMEFPDFIGTFYSSSDNNPALASNPDTVIAYVPNGTNQMQMYDKAGTVYQWRVVNDVSDYNRSALYAAFSGGDYPYNYAHNEQISDGSAVLIIKDSFGNAVIPFLVDHYEHIYWVDYRYYAEFCANTGKASSAISALVEEKGINDVIAMNNINSTGADVLIDDMAEIFK